MKNDNQNVNINNPVEIKGANGQSINAIPWEAYVVTPHDTNTFRQAILFIGTGGDVKVMPAGQTTFVTFKNIPDASFLPVYVIAVHTDTAATDILACY